MPVKFRTEDQRARYGRFNTDPDRTQLGGFFHLEPPPAPRDDMQRRPQATRLGRPVGCGAVSRHVHGTEGSEGLDRTRRGSHPSRRQAPRRRRHRPTPTARVRPLSAHPGDHHGRPSPGGVRSTSDGRHPANLLVRHVGEGRDPPQPPPLVPRGHHRRRQRRQRHQLLRLDIDRFCRELVDHPPAVRSRTLAGLREMLDETRPSKLSRPPWPAETLCSAPPGPPSWGAAGGLRTGPPVPTPRHPVRFVTVTTAQFSPPARG